MRAPRLLHRRRRRLSLLAKPAIHSLLLVLLFAHAAFSQSVSIHPAKARGDFMLVAEGKAAPLIIDPSAPRVVAIAANCLADDIASVAGLRPKILSEAP